MSTTKTKISILGSCVCRDMFEIPSSKTSPDTGKYIIDCFVQSVNPISAISDSFRQDLIAQISKELPKQTANGFIKEILL